MTDADKLTTEEKARLRDMVLAVSGTGQEAGPGYVVETKNGKIGRTYHRDELVNSKQVVYVDGKKLLCNPTTLKLRGFID